MSAPAQEGRRDGRGPRPFRGRVIGAGPGSPPLIEVVIELAPERHGGSIAPMRLRIPFRQAVSLSEQIAGAIERARRDGLVPADQEA